MAGTLRKCGLALTGIFGIVLIVVSVSSAVLAMSSDNSEFPTEFTEPYLDISRLSTGNHIDFWGKHSNKAEFTLFLKNPTDIYYEYIFNSSHIYDIIVTKNNGSEVRRWPAANTIFKDSPVTITLTANETVYLGVVTWSNYPQGDYRVRAVLVGYNLSCVGTKFGYGYGSDGLSSWGYGSAGPEYFGADGTTIAAGATGAGVAAAAVGVLTCTQVGKFAGFGLVAPLFTRLKKRKVLDNFTRGQIQGYVIANPGAHMNAIRDQFGISNGEVAYHLRVLEREGFVTSMTDGFKRRFYPGEHVKPASGVKELSVTESLLVSLMERSPGISQSDLARMANTSSQVVNYHIRKLWTAGLITLDKDGRVVRCTVKKDQLALFKLRQVLTDTFGQVEAE